MVRVFCSDVLAKYFTNFEQVSAAVQMDLYVNMFIDQNQEWFRSDPLVCAWLVLLESDLDALSVSIESERELSSELLANENRNEQIIDGGDSRDPDETSWGAFDLKDVLDTAEK